MLLQYWTFIMRFWNHKGRQPPIQKSNVGKRLLWILVLYSNTSNILLEYINNKTLNIFVRQKGICSFLANCHHSDINRNKITIWIRSVVINVIPDYGPLFPIQKKQKIATQSELYKLPLIFWGLLHTKILLCAEYNFYQLYETHLATKC